MADYYVKIQNMAVGYHGEPLIQDINIGIEKGEIVTLIGPNGAGKSTILKSMTRQLQMLSGNVYVDTQDLQGMSYKDLAKRMAVVLTERMKPEMMTCHDIVATGRYPYTGRLGILSREDEEKVEAAMEAVGIFRRSAMDRDSVCFWPEPSARNRRLSCWMNRRRIWMCIISWNFWQY
jgi:iron complex transport system ATP-binding protein